MTGLDLILDPEVCRELDRYLSPTLDRIQQQLHANQARRQADDGSFNIRAWVEKIWQML